MTPKPEGLRLLGVIAFGNTTKGITRVRLVFRGISVKKEKLI
jgi:hypothetical protein